MYNFRDLRNVHSHIIFYLIFQDEEELKDPLSAQLEDQKAIVFLSTLLQLFTVCHLSGCSSAVDPSNIEVIQHGAAIVVKYTCNQHHTQKWCSSPTIGEGRRTVYVINALLASYCLTCGLHISQVRDKINNLIHLKYLFSPYRSDPWVLPALTRVLLW